MTLHVKMAGCIVQRDTFLPLERRKPKITHWVILGCSGLLKSPESRLLKWGNHRLLIPDNPVFKLREIRGVKVPPNLAFNANRLALKGRPNPILVALLVKGMAQMWTIRYNEPVQFLRCCVWPVTPSGSGLFYCLFKVCKSVYFGGGQLCLRSTSLSTVVSISHDVISVRQLWRQLSH